MEDAMHEQRTSPRIPVDEDIEVFDINSGQLLGHLGNISSGGFMLLSSRTLAIGQLFQLRIALPQPIDGNASLEIGAECLWFDEAAGRDAWIGFHIIDISDQGISLIARLIEAWSR